MKITIILIICTVIVLICVKQIKRHTQAVKQCFLVIDNIEILLSYRNSSVDEIIHNLIQNDLYNELSFLSVIESNINKNINDYACNKNVYSCIDSLKLLDEKDKESIKAFLSMLGKSDLNGQIMNCQVYKEYFKNKYRSLENKEIEKCKSISAIIIGISLFIAIIIA